jgi:hypothetical protein
MAGSGVWQTLTTRQDAPILKTALASVSCSKKAALVARFEDIATPTCRHQIWIRIQPLAPHSELHALIAAAAASYKVEEGIAILLSTASPAAMPGSAVIGDHKGALHWTGEPDRLGLKREVPIDGE